MFYKIHLENFHKIDTHTHLFIIFVVLIVSSRGWHTIKAKQLLLWLHHTVVILLPVVMASRTMWLQHACVCYCLYYLMFRHNLSEPSPNYLFFHLRAEPFKVIHQSTKCLSSRINFLCKLLYEHWQILKSILSTCSMELHFIGFLL